MSYLPFQNTKVSERKSMAGVVGLLGEIEFDEVMQATNKSGRMLIIATYKSARFHFEIQPERITSSIIKELGPRKKQRMEWNDEEKEEILSEIKEQAMRIGWRLLHLHVKALTDSIKLGVLDVSEAFAGNLVVPSPDGPIRLAEHLTRVIETGKFESPEFTSPLMISAPK